MGQLSKLWSLKTFNRESDNIMLTTKLLTCKERKRTYTSYNKLSRNFGVYLDNFFLQINFALSAYTVNIFISLLHDNLLLVCCWRFLDCRPSWDFSCKKKHLTPDSAGHNWEAFSVVIDYLGTLVTFPCWTLHGQRYWTSGPRLMGCWYIGCNKGQQRVTWDSIISIKICFRIFTKRAECWLILGKNPYLGGGWWWCLSMMGSGWWYVCHAGL